MILHSLRNSKVPATLEGQFLPWSLGGVSDAQGDALSAEMCRRGCTTNGGRFGDGQTNGVCPGTAMGRMGKSISQVRSSGTSFSWEFIAWSQVISCPV